MKYAHCFYVPPFPREPRTARVFRQAFGGESCLSFLEAYKQLLLHPNKFSRTRLVSHGWLQDVNHATKSHSVRSSRHVSRDYEDIRYFLARRLRKFFRGRGASKGAWRWHRMKIVYIGSFPSSVASHASVCPCSATFVYSPSCHNLTTLTSDAPYICLPFSIDFFFPRSCNVVQQKYLITLAFSWRTFFYTFEW